MKGGDNIYFVTSRDYGSGFVEMLMDSSLVHLMLFVNRENLPLGLAHNSYAMYLSFGGFVVWLCAEVWPWRRHQACEGNPT